MGGDTEQELRETGEGLAMVYPAIEEDVGEAEERRSAG